MHVRGTHAQCTCTSSPCVLNTSECARVRSSDTEAQGITADELGSARDLKVPAECQQSQEKMCRLHRLAQLSSNKGSWPMGVLELPGRTCGSPRRDCKEPVREAMNPLTPEASSVAFAGLG